MNRCFYRRCMLAVVYIRNSRSSSYTIAPQFIWDTYIISTANKGADPVAKLSLIRMTQLKNFLRQLKAIAKLSLLSCQL